MQVIGMIAVTGSGHSALLGALPLWFESPGYLALLALLPLIVLLSFRSLSGLGAGRRFMALLARCGVVTVMVLALAGAHRRKTTDDLSVVYLIDRSSSVPAAQQLAGFSFVERAQKALRPAKDRMGVIAFDGQSTVEQLPMGALGIKGLGEAVRPDQTNIANAVSMGLALFTDDTVRRLVLISDGNENVGQIMDEVDRLKAAGIPVDVLPLRYEHGNEVVFERLSAPPTATADETIDLQMVLRAQQPVGGRVLLFHNDRQIDLDPSGPEAGYRVSLETGANRLKIPIPLRVAGAHRFRAQFEPDDKSQDTVTANNEGRAFTVVSGQGRILILAAGSADSAPQEWSSASILARALESEKLIVDLAPIGSQPLDQVRLLEYSLVILSNVPAHLVGEDERKALASYVRDLGGGLIMVGGDESFGAGGWADTPIEEVMPVSFDIKSKKQIPKGALVLCMHACEIPQGNYWGERVAVAAVKTLSSRDLVGVLSYQWHDAAKKYWDVPLQPVGDKARIVQMIKQMQMGDMPDLDAVMRPGVEELVKRNDAAARHMIVISDFDPSPPGQDLIDTMKRHNITCSTVAIGWGGHPIDVKKAQWMANATGGKYYTTEKFEELPQIFIKESKIVRRSLIQESPFTPALVNTPSSVVEGLRGEGAPQLGGLVLTSPKPLATVPLVRKTDEGTDPILAHWQVGLGKSVAFTSGLWNRWGTEWAAWPKFSKIWAQIARWASRQSAAAAFDVSTSVSGGKGRIRIDALDKSASAINSMNIAGMLVDPRSDAHSLALQQVGPGRYEAEFDARDKGSYVFNLNYGIGRGPDAVSGTLQTGLSVAFSPEFRELRTNEALLRELADRTGGRVLDPASAESAFDMTALQRAEARRSIWEDLVRWMLLLFLIDVAIRRIAIHPIEMLRKIRAFLGEMAGRRPAAEGSAAVLTTLRGTREKAREGMEGSSARPQTDAGRAPSRSAKYEAPVPSGKSTEDLSKALGGASETDQPVVARPTRKPVATNEADFTSRLKQAKQKARDAIQGDEQEGTRE